MAADREVIRSFLVSLGFQIDTGGLRRFTGALMQSSKGAAAVTGTIAGVAVAAEAMVQVFSSGMEKMYYSSRRTKASVENIQAVKFAFKQIGLSEDDALASLENFSRGLRTNPGLMALLKNLGVKTEGRDRVVVMTDLVKRLSTMPHYVGAQFAEMFGMDEKTFFMVKEMMPQLEAAQERRRQLNRAAGIDAEAAAKASQEYSNAIRDLWEQVEVLSGKIAIELMPEFKRFIGWASENLPVFAGYVTEVGKAIGNWDRISFEPKHIAGFILEQLDLWSRWLGLIETVKGALIRFTPAGIAYDLYNRAQTLAKTSPASGGRAAAGSIGGGGTAIASAPAGAEGGNDRAAFLANLEAQYGLPRGLLDRVWKAESNRGDPRFLRSPKGAEGPFGFMPKTGEQYGLRNKDDRYDFYKSAGASASYYSDLMRKYGGDEAKAAGAYNWGPGNMDKYGLGRAPKETRDYIGKVAGDKAVSITQKTDIHIASTDPARAGREVAAEQGRVNGDLVRNFVTQIQ